MNLEDERKLKYDRRLRNRRGLVSESEVAAYEATLPDVAQKIASGDGAHDTPVPPAAGGSSSGQATS